MKETVAPMAPRKLKGSIVNQHNDTTQLLEKERKGMRETETNEKGKEKKEGKKKKKRERTRGEKRVRVVLKKAIILATIE